jgi:hypothetical protein
VGKAGRRGGRLCRTHGDARWRHVMSLNLAATNKFLAKRNTPRRGSKRLRNGSATRSGSRRLPGAARRRISRNYEAKSIARHLGLTVRQVRYAADRFPSNRLPTDKVYAKFAAVNQHRSLTSNPTMCLKATTPQRRLRGERTRDRGPARFCRPLHGGALRTALRVSACAG